jgi:hypothetical protein
MSVMLGGVLGFEWEAMAFWIVGYFYPTFAFLRGLSLTMLERSFTTVCIGRVLAAFG